MSYTLRIPRKWYNELNWQGQDKGFSKSFVAALIMQESSWNPDAEGDYVDRKATSFGLGQITVPAAKDAGWTGTDTQELKDAVRNITLCVTYLKKCEGWARTYDKRGEIATYTLAACTLSVYNQGPGGFSKNGITLNLVSYVQPIQAWVKELTAGGIYPDDSGSYPTPPPGGPETPPPVPDETTPDLEAIMSKYAEAVRKEVAKEREARPWPPADDYNTEVGTALYFFATALRDVVTIMREWLGRL